jgi:hypothetical protein
MRITPEGRVGIGTKTPETTLDVAGTVRTTGSIQFGDGTTLSSAKGLAPGKDAPSGSAGGNDPSGTTTIRQPSASSRAHDQSSRSIGLQDLTGVSLAAIKELNQRTDQLQKTVEVEELREQSESMINSEMERRLATLEQLMLSQQQTPKLQ